jgi:Flp pilus assembly protein TadB
LDDPGKSKKPQKKWQQLILVIVEIAIFLLVWILLILGILSGYFAIFLLLALIVVIYFSLRDKSEDY